MLPYGRKRVSSVLREPLSQMSLTRSGPTSRTGSSHSLWGTSGFTRLISQGNAFTDTQAEPYPSHLLPLGPSDLPSPKYSPQQLAAPKPRIHTKHSSMDLQRSKLLPDQQIQDIVTNLYNCFHMGSLALYRFLAPVSHIPLWGQLTPVTSMLKPLLGDMHQLQGKAPGHDE